MAQSSFSFGPDDWWMETEASPDNEGSLLLLVEDDTRLVRLLRLVLERRRGMVLLHDSGEPTP